MPTKHCYLALVVCDGDVQILAFDGGKCCHSQLTARSRVVRLVLAQSNVYLAGYNVA